MTHWLDKVITILDAETSNLRELARLAGGDPRTFYKGINIEKLDLTGQDIEGMEFSEENFDIQREQAELELHVHQQNWPVEQVVHSIRRVRRQEERAALILAEFLNDRSRAADILQRYRYDSAMNVRDVIRRLEEILQDEIYGKKRSDLYIARRVSGAFARTDANKRHLLTYFIAKYLSYRPDIRRWLRAKENHRIGLEKRKQLERWLGYD